MNRTIRRETVLAELRSRCDHPTAEELFSALRGKLPSLSRGTVYRNLDQLVQTGQVRQLDCAGRSRRYDGNVSPHHHLRCMACGGVSDVEPGELQPVEHLLNDYAVRHGIASFSLEFSGCCPQCRSRQEKSRKCGAGSFARSKSNRRRKSG